MSTAERCNGLSSLALLLTISVVKCSWRTTPVPAAHLRRSGRCSHAVCLVRPQTDELDLRGERGLPAREPELQSYRSAVHVSVGVPDTEHGMSVSQPPELLVTCGFRGEKRHAARLSAGSPRSPRRRGALTAARLVISGAPFPRWPAKTNGAVAYLLAALGGLSSFSPDECNVLAHLGAEQRIRRLDRLLHRLVFTVTHDTTIFGCIIFGCIDRRGTHG